MVTIDSIVIEGNRKTKARIITRELTFAVGDSLPLSNMGVIMEQNRLRLLSTSLFINVKMNVQNWSENNHVAIHIICVENWYLYPVPIFELADRNFSDWWVNQNRDLKRVNLGMRLTYNNATGQRDPFSLTLQLGYTPRYSFSYSIPYINKKQTIGLSGNFSSSVNREIGDRTVNNKIKFNKGDSSNFVVRRIGASLGMSYTPGLFVSHGISVGYTNNKVDTTIAKNFNSEFYSPGSVAESYFYVSYGFSIDKRDFRYYAENGYRLNGGINKNGLFGSDNINNMDVQLRYTQYQSLSKKLSYEGTIKGKLALMRSFQPLNHRRGLGYGGDFVRGYELYVTDALDYAFVKNSLRFKWFDKDLKFDKWTKKKRVGDFLNIPLKSYFTVNFDAGVSNDPFYGIENNNKLNNSVLYGGGVGLDILAYYGLLWRFEYSLNQLGEGRLYFSYSASF